LTTEKENSNIQNEVTETVSNKEVTETNPTSEPTAETTQKVEETTVEETAKPKKEDNSHTDLGGYPEDSTAHDDFDWSMDKEGFSNYETEEKVELDDLYSVSFASIEEGTVVQGTVVSVTDSDVVVNIGFKSDGLVPINEFRDMPEVKAGDEINVYVETTEDKLGQLVLSRKKALAENAWARIISAKENDEIIMGHVISRTKGGLVVDVFGIDTFLPGSQIDIKPIRDYDQYVGKDMEFKVVKINEAFKNVVISHKALIEDDIEQQKSDILSKLEKGQVLEGVVKNMTTFGVFVDLGGLDGLLHITDISWGRINHPEEVLKLDEKVNVVVLDFDDDKKRISLGLKQLSEHPWESIGESIKVGDKISGRVVTVADYGAFLELQPGVEGLIHVSEMSWSQHLRNPQDFMKVGDQIEAVVLTFEKEEHKMSLGIKQLTPDPWGTIAQKYASGSKHTGIVKNLTNYGLFVELEEGVDGLVHVSDLSWNKKIKHPSEFVTKGQELEVVVLEVDTESRRLSLGHKQLEENPWDTFATVFTMGSRHEGTITEISEKGATIQMPYGVEAFAPKRHIKTEDNRNLTVDDTLLFEVIEFSKDNRRIIVSHTNIWKEAEVAKEAEAADKKKKDNKRTSKMMDQINSSKSASTLGEVGDALSALKAQMESAEKSEASKKVAKVKKEEPKKEEAPKEEAPKVEEKKEGVVSEGGADDLKKISKIGPASEKKLNGLGINSYKDLADLTDEKIQELEEKDGVASLEQWHKWIEEAKALMA
jgi:small subunit ribosomal protein S1